MKNSKDNNLFDLQDLMLSIQLFGKPAKELFINVIEYRCSDKEAEDILIPLLLSDDKDDINRAKMLFYNKLTTEEKKKYNINYIMSINQIPQGL